MKKGQKIRRYGNIYDRGPGSGSPLIVVAIFAGLLVFALIGWSIYTPLRDLILGEKPSDLPFSSQSLVLSEPQENPLTPASSAPAVPAPETVLAPDKVKGLYLPPSALGDDAVLDALIAGAKNAGMTSLLLDAKDATGTVLFDSQNEHAVDNRTVAGNAFDAGKVAKKISDAGLMPIARLQAFRDPRMANLVRTMSVKYYDTDAIWLDNAPELGGNPWLNPYSDEAQQYLIDLAVELTRAGFGQIILDSVQFPSGVGLEKAGFGANSAAPRADVLRSFLEQLENAVQAAGGEVILGVAQERLGGTGDEAAAAATRAGNQVLYGGDPIDLVGARAALTVRRGVTEIESAVGVAMERAPNTQWVALIAAEQEDGAPQTADVTARQLTALQKLGVNGYILCNPQGNYMLQ